MTAEHSKVVDTHSHGLYEAHGTDVPYKPSDQGQDIEFSDTSETSDQIFHSDQFFEDYSDQSDTNDIDRDDNSDTVEHSETETIYDSDH